MKSNALFILLLIISSFFMSTSIIHSQKTQNVSNVIADNMKNNTDTIEASNATAFIKNPNNYSFKCTPNSTGEVLNATLTKEGKMTIVYQSTWINDGDHSGVLFGMYNPKNNRFVGRYKTNDGRFEGEQNLTFAQNGEAQGTWDNGYGTTMIQLKK